VAPVGGYPTPLTPEPEEPPRARRVLIGAVVTAALGVLAALGYYKHEPVCPPCPCAVTAPAAPLPAAPPAE
jgi:hypothetical protein